jgi:hypothetical protein
MTKHSQFIATLLLILATAGQTIYGQSKAITFRNNLNAYYSETRSKDTLLGFRFFEPKINEITLNPDATFEFWSRPNMSCSTWNNYKGTWKRDKDTIFFYDHYQVDELDTRATYKKDSKKEFVISFKTDKNLDLKNRNIKIQYWYDYDAHLENPETNFTLTADNSVVIPFADIPNLDKLASIRVEYLLNFTEERFNFLTENRAVNLKQKDIPNIINVEFVEKPKKEIIYRTIKSIVKDGNLKILSTTKTTVNLPDYYRDIEFEDSYALSK